MLDELRKAMRRDGLDAFLISSSDPHGSEYPPEHFKERIFFSGFSGDAGTLLVLPESAGLWVDGRFFAQAARELRGSDITQFNIGEPGVPDIFDHIAATVRGKLGLDLRSISSEEGIRLKKMGLSLVDSPELIDELWKDRPPLPTGKAYVLPPEIAGEDAGEKLKAVRKLLAERGARALLLSDLDEIAWLLNIRGCDVRFRPVVLCFAIIEPNAAYLFIDGDKACEISDKMCRLGIRILPYRDVYEFVEGYGKEDAVIAALSGINYKLFLSLQNTAQLLDEDPIPAKKARKNKTELENMRRIHLQDGIALTRFLIWLKSHPDVELTEISANAKMTWFRKHQPDYLGPSFESICGYGPNAALLHYSASPETNTAVKREGLLLLDSGGLYRGGTTDVTRTYALGPVKQKEKTGFTVVLESMLAFMELRFPRGSTGCNIDAVARVPFWERGWDYNCGTGHGVGYMLNVHEGPPYLRQRRFTAADRGEIVPGMMLTIEPGIYFEGEYGVRLENVVECVEDEEHPDFLRFEPVTLAPIDLDAVDFAALSQKGRERLNRYHDLVYQKLSAQMLPDELLALRRFTRPVS